MGRSLYFDDERRDVTEDLYTAFRSADRGDWGEAVWAFSRVEDRVNMLRRLVRYVEAGDLDPNLVEGLVPASQGAWPHEWGDPDELVSESDTIGDPDE